MDGGSVDGFDLRLNRRTLEAHSFDAGQGRIAMGAAANADTAGEIPSSHAPSADEVVKRLSTGQPRIQRQVQRAARQPQRSCSDSGPDRACRSRRQA